MTKTDDAQRHCPDCGGKLDITTGECYNLDCINFPTDFDDFDPENDEPEEPDEALGRAGADE